MLRHYLDSTESGYEKYILTVFDGRDNVTHVFVFIEETNIAAPLDDGGRVAGLTLGHEDHVLADFPSDHRIESGDGGVRFVARVERQEGTGAHRQSDLTRLEAKGAEQRGALIRNLIGKETTTTLIFCVSYERGVVVM